MTDYDTFGRGGVTYPIPVSITNTLLKDADPAIYYTLDYFQSVLNTYMRPRLLTEIARSPAITSITTAVSAVVPLDPVPYLQEQHFKFPLLAVYRKKETFREKSVALFEDDAEWAVDYILPPVTGGQLERLAPFLRAAGQILFNRIENMMDPAYSNGAAVWDLAGISKIELVEASYGGYAGTGGLFFPAWRGKLMVKQIDSPTVAEAGLVDLQGIDNEIDEEGILPADGTTEVLVLQAVGAGVTIDPLTAVVIRGATQTFTAEGGSGATVVFSLLSNNSGGSINAATGVYTAGATPNVYDIVNVRDSYSRAFVNAVVQVI